MFCNYFHKLIQRIHPFISLLISLLCLSPVCLFLPNICNRTPPSTSPSPWQLPAGIRSESIGNKKKTRCGAGISGCRKFILDPGRLGHADEEDHGGEEREEDDRETKVARVDSESTGGQREEHRASWVSEWAGESREWRANRLRCNFSDQQTTWQLIHRLNNRPKRHSAVKALV